jgi:3-oxoacyl-[acyl-carrier protein] reductase
LFNQDGTDAVRRGHRPERRLPDRADAFVCLNQGGWTVDLGLQGKKALVCAASQGLGKACAMSLAREGVSVTITARTKETLEATAEEIRRETGAEVVTVVGDITTPAGRAAALSACPVPDILINNAGGPPPGDFRDWDRDAWIKALDANMLTPIELIKATVDGMIERRFGRIVNITSAAVKAPIDYLGLSNGARAGLTGFVAGLSRTTVKHNVTINNLLPGPFDTARMRSSTAAGAKKAGISMEEALAARAAQNPANRFGQPEEFGMACAFICAASSGYMTGQNILLDGGAYPGTL